MKLGIFSDSHDHLDHIDAAVRRFKEMNVDLVCHAGDFVSPFALRGLRDLDCDVVGVLGDNDGNQLGLVSGFTVLGRLMNSPHRFTIDGLSVLLMHRPDGLESFVHSQDYDLIIYGHTHRAEIRTNDRTTIINPGESSGWTRGSATAAWFDTSSRQAEIFPLVS